MVLIKNVAANGNVSWSTVALNATQFKVSDTQAVPTISQIEASADKGSLTSAVSAKLNGQDVTILIDEDCYTGKPLAELTSGDVIYLKKVKYTVSYYFKNGTVDQSGNYTIDIPANYVITIK